MYCTVWLQEVWSNIHIPRFTDFSVVYLVVDIWNFHNRRNLCCGRPSGVQNHILWCLATDRGLRGVVDCVWNMMAHAQKPRFVFRRNGRVHLNRRGASVQSTAGSRGVRISVSNAGYTTFRGSVRVLATHPIRQFPLHFPSRASPCATRFQTHSNPLEHSILKHWRS